MISPDAGSGRDRMSSAQAGLLADAGPASAAWRLRAVEARALLRLAAPIALIALVNMGMSVTDTAMVSAMFCTDALAAGAVGCEIGRSHFSTSDTNAPIVRCNPLTSKTHS